MDRMADAHQIQPCGLCGSHERRYTNQYGFKCECGAFNHSSLNHPREAPLDPVDDDSDQFWHNEYAEIESVDRTSHA